MPKTIRVYKSFIEDIVSHGDASFAKRVVGHLNDVFEGNENKSNDHRYNGIDNAWIRYLSRGKTAYRLIYLKQGGYDVFYRCGSHSVEDNLAVPTDTNEVVNLELSSEKSAEDTVSQTIYTNHKAPIILSAFTGRSLIPHKEVFLISPFIDPTILYRGSKVGQVLDKMKSDGTDIKIVTSLDSLDKFDEIWQNLDARNIELAFLPKLHSKIYLFMTNEYHHHHLSSRPSLGIIGSSNLTKRGIAEKLGDGNYETNYSVSDKSIEKLYDLAIDHYARAIDFRKAKQLKRNI